MIGLNVFRDAVRTAFTYDDGVLRWRVSPSRNVKIGDPAGSPNQRGYLQIQWNRKLFVAHKLIFAYHHGWTPPIVDHIDGDISNNKIENLRAATVSENQCNAKRRSNNSSGYKNVRKHGRKWQVCIIKDGRRHYYGCYEDPQEAAIIAQRAREKLHGTFARHA
jgi:hypothetical protein